MSSSSYVGGVGGGPARDYSGYYVLPAAPVQRQLWFLCQLDPASNAAYNVVSAVRLDGRLDTVLLQRALNEVVRRHESLRTGVGLVDGDPHQVVVPETLVSLPLVDLTAHPPHERRDRVLALAGEQAATPFTLDEPPLLRVVLAREAPDRHVLVVVIHHIVCDGWSTEIFYRDLAERYRLSLAGEGNDPEDPPIQYADYVAWLDESLAGEPLRELTEHWRTTLAGATPLDLPVDRPRDTRNGAAGASVEARLDPGATAGVDELAARWDVTRFVLLLAAFKLTLARVTGQDDVTVGTPVAGRHHPDTEALIGYFANTLVLRTRLPAAGSFAATVDAVRTSFVDAFSHQRMPFDRLVEELRQTRVPHRNPLFDVMFSLQNTPGVTVELPGLTLSTVEMDVTAARFDLWLTVLPDGSGLRLRLDYARDLYDEETASGLLRHYLAVLDGALRDPDARAATLPLVTEEELATLDGWSTGAPLVPSEDTVLELLRSRPPTEVAVASPDGDLSYDDLRDRVGRLADRLRDEGVGPGTLVATPASVSVRLLVAVLAILEVGAVLTFGRRHPPSGAFVGGSTAEPDGWRVTTGPRFDPVDQDGTIPHRARADEPALRPRDHTGRTAATALTHRALFAAVTAVAHRLDLRSEEDVALVVGDRPDVVELLLALRSGRRLLLTDPAGTPGAAPEDGVLAATAPTWRSLLTSGWLPPSTLRLVCRGPVVPEDLRAALARSGATVYGSRETPVSAAPLGLAPARPGGARRLGPPLPGTRRRLLDAAGRPAPPGTVGELWVGGPAVATSGGDQHPPGADGLVPTGERYRHTRDGDLEFVGYRTDLLAAGDAVVSPTRIEEALSSVDRVDAAAVAVTRVAEDTRLVCWLRLDPTAAAGPPRARDEVIASVRARAVAALEPHEVPALFGVLPDLPRHADGTVDRRALAALPTTALLGAVDTTAPRNRLERIVVGIFRDLLPVAEIGVHADFFALGGHSLLAAKVIARVRAETGVLVPVRDFFRRPTAAGLAEAVAELDQGGDREATDRTTALRGQLAGMTDEEVAQLLRQLG